MTILLPEQEPLLDEKQTLERRFLQLKNTIICLLPIESGDEFVHRIDMIFPFIKRASQEQLQNYNNLYSEIITEVEEQLPQIIDNDREKQRKRINKIMK